MAYLFDGGFTGFLYSMRETGRKLKDGAKELVEDFISGFNGHGWKLWKRNDSWRLEVDELLVRKSMTTFEMIISQITSIKGSQAITQGNAKVKAVTLVDNADVYEEQNIIVYNENFLDSKWYTFASDEGTPNLQVTKAKIICSPNTGNNVQALMFKGNTVIESFKFTVQELSGSGIIFSYFEDGDQMTEEITEIGEYDYPGSDGTGDESQEGGFVFLNDTSVTVTQIASSNDIIQTISQKPSYRLEIDNELNTISEFDLVRCQKGNKFYYVQVGSVFQYYINIPISEFETDAETGEILNPPTAGDELVQFGNASYQEKYKNRHSAIYMHLDENEPAIDLMTDIYSKDWSKGNIIKTRIGGNLPGTDGDRGFYCVNGKLIFVDEIGNTVSVINPDGSASFAYGKLSWDKDGSPKFSGTILVNIDDNNIWEVNSSGDNIIGTPNGKRIVISPNSSDIRFYNSDNTNVISIESTKKNNISDIFNAETVNIDVNKTPIVFTDNVKSAKITNRFETKASGSVIINARIINDTPYFMNKSVYIRILSYTSITEQTPYSKVNVYSNSGKGNWTSDIVNLSIYISNGFHEIEVEIYSEASQSTLTIQTFTAVFAPSLNLSNYFSNGLSIGETSENSFIILNSPTVGIVGNITNRIAGIKINPHNILVKQKQEYGLIPCVICHGKVNFNEISSSYPQYFEFVESYDDYTPTLNRGSANTMFITIPSTWTNVNENNTIISLTGQGCYVKLNSWISILDNPSIVVEMSETSGSFYFELKRF